MKKVMKTVTEIAKQFNLSADTIRYYTKLGLLAPKRDQANGYRLYGAEEERKLRFFISAKRLGFSLKDIREIVDMAVSGDTACPLVRKLIGQRLDVIRQEMLDAQKLMSQMESALKSWQKLPDRAPSATAICHLIETWDCIDAGDSTRFSDPDKRITQ